MTIFGLFVDLTYQLEYAPKIAEFHGQQEAKLESYLHERSFLSTHPLFAAQSSEGSNFNDYAANFVMKNPAQTLVKMDDRKKVLSAGKKWLEKRHYIVTNEAINSLFGEMDKYSYWKLTESIANENLLSPIDLVVAGQIYLQNIYQDNPQEIASALAKTRKLSALLLSTDSLNFKLAGLSLLEKEHQLINEMNAKKNAEFIAWEPVPLTDLKRYRVFLESTNFYLNFITSPDILTKVFLDKTPPPGLCAVYNQKQLVLDWAESYLQSNFPFEPNFSSNIATIDKIKNQMAQNCTGPFAKYNGERTLASRLPYLRRIRGIDFLLQPGHPL